MATLAIQVGIAVGVSVASSLLAPKPKLQAVDRGKLDDIRITVMEEGSFKPLVYGRRARLGGVIRWGTETQEYITRTPGRSAGKGGGGRQAEAPTNNFTYRKSFAVMVCGNRIKRYRRIWDDLDVIFNDDGADAFADFYEAELASLSGPTSVTDGTDYSGGRAVTLGTGGVITFEGVSAAAAGSNTLTIFYKAASSAGFTVAVNGVTHSVPTVPGSLVETATLSVTLNRGGNEIVIFYTGLASVAIDRIHVRAPSAPTPDTRPVVTHVLDEGSPYPDDPDDPSPFYNAAVSYDANGTATGTLTGGGQASFEFYTGTETQLQSPIIVAVEGAGAVPAWRGESVVVFDDYLVRGTGQLGNFTFEVEPYFQDLADIVTDLYRQDDRVGASEIDFSALAGITVDGFVVHTREQLASWITQLQVWFNFDIVPIGGKVVAVPRGGAPAFTLTEADLYARRESDETPKGPVRRTIEDPADAPQSVDILYLDSSDRKDFHTAGEQAQAQVGDAFDRDTLTFAIVSNGDTAVAVGRRYLDAKALEQRPFEFATGPKFRHLSPTDVGTIVLPDVTHTVRLTSKSAELQGLVKWKAVPDRASLYSQTFPSQLSLGRETPVDAFPANTLLAVADCVPLRQEDVDKLVVYAAGCPRGRGAWRGFALNKKGLTDEAERLGAIQKAATIGVVETASFGSSEGGYQAERQFVVKLYAGELESRMLDDVRADRLNLALYGVGSRWEVIQFVSAVPQAPTYPFVAQYLITGTFTGLYGTEPSAGTHEDGDLFVLFDEAVQGFEVRPADVGPPVTFVAQTFGQAYADAEAASSVTFALLGLTRLPLAIARVETDVNTGLAPRDANGNMLIEVWPRTNAELVGDEYLIEYLSDDRSQVLHSASFKEGLPGPAVLASYVPLLGTGTLQGISGDVAGSTFKLKSLSLVSGVARSLQKIISMGPGNFVEAELRASGASVSLGLMSAGKDWRTADPDFQIFMTGIAGAHTLSVYEGSTLLFTEDAGAYIAGGTRFRLELLDKRIRFYKGKQSDGSPFLAESAAPINYPLVALIQVTVDPTSGFGEGRAGDVMMLTNPLPQTVLTTGEQQQYYGGPKKPVQVTIRQHSGSRELGYGLPFKGAI
jgi:hypothetical protein